MKRGIIDKKIICFAYVRCVYLTGLAASSSHGLLSNDVLLRCCILLVILLGSSPHDTEADLLSSRLLGNNNELIIELVFGLRSKVSVDTLPVKFLGIDISFS